jgi:hypothetical protein
MAFYGAQEPWSPTVSGIALYNPTSKIDKTCITFSMWKTTIRVSIVPAIESGTDEAPRYGYKNGVNIWLTPQKANQFAQILKGYRDNPDQFDNYGVATSQAIITVDKPDTFGYPGRGPVISIRRVSEEGNVELSYSYECNIDGTSAIVGFNVNNPKAFKQDTSHFQNIELDSIITQLEQYYLAMTNATAFSVLSQVYPYLDKIAAKMAVDLSGNLHRQQRSNGFFAGGNGGMGVGDTTFGSGPAIGSANQSIIANPTNQTYDASALKKLVEGAD